MASNIPDIIGFISGKCSHRKLEDYLGGSEIFQGQVGGTGNRSFQDEASQTRTLGTLLLQNLKREK